MRRHISEVQFTTHRYQGAVIYYISAPCRYDNLTIPIGLKSYNQYL